MHAGAHSGTRAAKSCEGSRTSSPAPLACLHRNRIDQLIVLPVTGQVPVHSFFAAISQVPPSFMPVAQQSVLASDLVASETAAVFELLQAKATAHSARPRTTFFMETSPLGWWQVVDPPHLECLSNTFDTF